MVTVVLHWNHTTKYMYVAALPISHSGMCWLKAKSFSQGTMLWQPRTSAFLILWKPQEAWQIRLMSEELVLSVWWQKTKNFVTVRCWIWFVWKDRTLDWIWWCRMKRLLITISIRHVTAWRMILSATLSVSSWTRLWLILVPTMMSLWRKVTVWLCQNITERWKSTVTWCIRILWHIAMVRNTSGMWIRLVVSVAVPRNPVLL